MIRRIEMEVMENENENINYYENWPLEQAERKLDIPLPEGMGTLLLGIWIFLSGIGLAVALLLNPILGLLIIGVPTLVGMVIRPTFALCIYMLVLPTGSGVGLGGMFTLNKGVGIAVAIAFTLNLLFTRPPLHFRNMAIWWGCIFFFWQILSIILNSEPITWIVELTTSAQFLIFVPLVHWIVEINGWKAFLWILRSYVVGLVGSTILVSVTGIAIQSMEETGGRYGATLGGAINANLMSALLGIGFLTSTYLFVKDKKAIWRIIYLIGMVILPAMLLKTGSRGGILGLGVAIASPLFFARQVWQKPKTAILSIVVLIVAAGGMGYIAYSGRLGASVSKRLTDIRDAEDSYSGRMSYIQQSISVVMRRPIGTGRFRWFDRSGIGAYPHNDFFYVMSLYGLPAATLLIVMVISLARTIKRIPLSPEKIYGRCILIFILLIGLKGMYIDQQFYWIFIVIISACETANRYTAYEEWPMNYEDTLNPSEQEFGQKY